MKTKRIKFSSKKITLPRWWWYDEVMMHFNLPEPKKNINLISISSICNHSDDVDEDENVNHMKSIRTNRRKKKINESKPKFQRCNRLK